MPFPCFCWRCYSHHEAKVWLLFKQNIWSCYTGAQRQTRKSHNSCNTCVPLRKAGWHAGICLLWEGPPLMYEASGKGRRCLKFILLRNVSPCLSCLLHNTGQKTSYLSRWCVPCISQAVAFHCLKHCHVSSVKTEGSSKCAPGLRRLLPCVPFPQEVRTDRFVHRSCHLLVPGCGHGQS